MINVFNVFCTYIFYNMPVRNLKRIEENSSVSEIKENHSQAEGLLNLKTFQSLKTIIRVDFSCVLYDEKIIK